MMLVVTMRGALEKRYGSEAYEQIRTAIKDFSKAAGAESLALDDPEEMKAVGAGTTLGSDAGSILSSLRQFTRGWNGASSLLILGGTEVVP